MAIICGVDPGRFGAFTLINTTEHTVECVDMPMYGIKKKTSTRYEPDAFGMADIFRREIVTHVYVEEVGFQQGDGGQGAFSFGRNYGTILGVCGAMQLATTKVRPAVWKRALRCTADKDQTIARAGELMPHCRKLWQRVRKSRENEGRAESALIALYGLSDLQFLVERPLMPIERT